MAKQVFYDDVEVGMEIPSLVKTPSTRQLVMWAGASGDYYEIHYDKDFALKNGLPGIIVHGRLKAAFLGQLMTDYVGDEGSLKKLACNYRGMDFPGDVLTCSGKVIKKYQKEGEHYMECEIWLGNSKGERSTVGTAVVTLPSKAKP